MDLFAIIESAAQSGSLGINGIKAPTEAQKMAGNYKMGRCDYKGMQLVFEQPRNSYREGVSKDGKRWRNRMAAHYGYIGGTTGADGDGIDIFVGTNPESEIIYVINQVDEAGKFDETKAMIGFLNEQDARRAYQESYDKDWRGLGEIVQATVDQFKWWLKYGDTTKPISRKILPYDGTLNMNEIQWDSAALPVGTDLAGVIYALRSEDTDGLLLDSVTADDILEAADSVLALDALVVPVAQLDRKMKQLQNIMNMAGGELSVSAMQVTAPFKNRGTTNVAAIYELSDGQTVSIYMHNPDTTPNKLMPTDDLVSWKWMLNKKDITILVAPEKGQDLNPREVARRVMRLAEKNSARFAKANANRAARMSNIAGLKQQVEVKAQTLKSIEDEIEQVQAKLDDPTRAPMPQNSEAVTNAPESELDFNASDVANFGAVEAARRAAWFEKYGYEKHKDDPAFIALKSYLLKQFGTDNISDFSGGLVKGVKPLDAALSYTGEPTDQELAVHGLNRDTHAVMKALVNLGWTNKTSDMKSKVVWYVQRSILGGFKGSVNPEGIRTLSAGVEGGNLVAKHGDSVLASVPYDASKSAEENAKVLNAAVDAIPNSGITPKNDEVDTKVQGRERIYNNGKTYKWDSALNRYTTGLGAKKEILKKSEMADIEIDGYSELSSFGNVEITDIGSENVYFKKNDIDYYTKLLNTDDWSVGAADFSGVVDPYGEQVSQVPASKYKPASEYNDVESIKSRLIEIRNEEIALIKKRSELNESFTDYLELKEALEQERKELGQRYQELKNSDSVAQPEDTQNSQTQEPIDQEQARYSAFNASELKMPTPPQLGVGKVAKSGTGFRLLSGGTGWTNGAVLDLGELSPSMKKAVEQKYDNGSAPTLDTERAQMLIDRNKSGNIMLKPVAFTNDRAEVGGKSKDIEAVLLADENEKFLIPLDKKSFAYFYKKYPNADFLGKSANDAVVVRKAGEVVGLIAPMRANAEMSRALKARDTNQQRAAEPVVMKKKTPSDVDAMIKALDLNTAEGFARAMQILVAKKRYEGGVEYMNEQLEKGYMNRDESFVYGAELADNFNSQVMENGSAFMPVAEAFARKDPLPLIFYFVGNNYESGERVFQMATGIKLLGLNKQKKTDAIYQWAGWTDEQIAAHNDMVAKAQAEQAEKESLKEKEQSLRNAWSSAEKARVSDNGKVISFAEYILKRAQNGFNKIEREKKGATYKYSLTDGETWSSINSPVFNGLLKAMNEHGGVIESLKFLGVMPEEQSAPSTNPDREYLSQVIAGQVDVMAPDVADKLVAIAEQYAGDADMSALAEQAAEAYSVAVVEKAKAALA